VNDVPLVRCPSCGATNRVPVGATSGRRAVCGRCKTPLPASSAASDSRPMIVTDARFADDVARSPLPVLLDLWAEWCGPCHMVAPTVEKLAADLAGRVRVAKLNIDDNPRTAAQFGVRSIPTLLILKDGQEVDRLIGVQPKEEILRRLQRVMGAS
jgi:thioredoxin 2